jgi:hypothetical protein
MLLGSPLPKIVSAMIHPQAKSRDAPAELAGGGPYQSSPGPAERGGSIAFIVNLARRCGGMMRAMVHVHTPQHGPT